MVHKLAIIAFTGLIGSAVCIGAAAAIGGRDFRDGLDVASFFNDAQRCKAVPGAVATSRTLKWDGSDHVGLSLRGHARYRPGSDDQVHVTGDPQVLAHLEVARATSRWTAAAGVAAPGTWRSRCRGAPSRDLKSPAPAA